MIKKNKVQFAQNIYEIFYMNGFITQLQIVYKELQNYQFECLEVVIIHHKAIIFVQKTMIAISIRDIVAGIRSYTPYTFCITLYALRIYNVPIHFSIKNTGRLTLSQSWIFIHYNNEDYFATFSRETLFCMKFDSVTGSAKDALNSVKRIYAQSATI